MHNEDELSPAETRTMVDDCEARESQLTGWEANFISSCSERLGKNQGLSNYQQQKLQEVWNKVTKDG